MASKEKFASGMKEEYEQEKADMHAKYDDLKQKFEAKEDELNAKNINFEKDQALNKQQLKFVEKQLEESKTHYDRTVQRYEEKIKIEKEEMQRELKDRSSRL
jgi:hypothetical protein